MRTLLTLNQDDIEEAIKEYAIKRGYVSSKPAKLTAYPETDRMDQPTGGYVISAEIEVETK